MDLTAMTPGEIDTRYAPIWELRLRALQTRREQGAIHAANKDRIDPASVCKANAAYQALNWARNIVLATDSVSDDYDAEWNRRGGWTQAWLVTSSDGHIHRSRHCHTLRWSTTIALIPQLSGLAEDDIVGEAGEAACTACYPSAPLEVRQRPAKFGPIAERRAAAALRAAEKAERAAVAAAKGIATPDGLPLLDDIGFTIKTERTAEIAYVNAAVQAEVWTDGWARESYPQRWQVNAHNEQVYADRLLAALAHKHDETMEAARERLALKVTKKLAAERRQNAKVAAEFARR